MSKNRIESIELHSSPDLIDLTTVEASERVRQVNGVPLVDVVDIEDVSDELEFISSLNSTAEIIKSRGFAEDVPSFSDQVQQEDRQMSFRYRSRDKKSYHLMEEHGGLAQLDQFLDDFVSTATAHDRGIGSFNQQQVKDLSDQASEMKEKLSFIGNPEYQRATKGIGEYWKNFLDEHPDGQICVISGVTKLSRYDKIKGRKPDRKSDDWLREDILLTYDEDELEAYGERIVTDPEKLAANPEKTKIVLLDDWSISGKQMRDVYKQLEESGVDPSYIDGNKVEVNLVVASPQRIENGLVVRRDEKHGDETNIPVRGYFRSRSCTNAPEENQGYVTGLHSSVNYGFRDELLKMCKVYDMLKKNGKSKTQLALLYVDPWYKDQSIEPVFSYSGDKIVKIPRRMDASND